MIRGLYLTRWIFPAVTVGVFLVFVSQVSADTTPTKAPTQQLTCKVNKDCTSISNNTVCIAELCTCEFGYYHESNTTQKCTQLVCTQNSECSQFGDAICYNGKCDCPTPQRHIDPTSQICYEFERIKDKCTAGTQCGPNSWCTRDHKCQCLFGNKIQDGSNECKPLKCSKEIECGDHTICDKDQKCACDAKQGFILDPKTQTCKLQIGQKCTGTSDPLCGDKSICFHGQCHCPLGMEPDETGINCRNFKCSKHENCHEKFASQQTMCRKQTQTCECFPPTLYKLDPVSQTCVNVTNPGCTTATANSCGDNADCINNQCKCKLGYAPNSITGKCEKISCNYYEDECEIVFKNSKCSKQLENPICVCKPLFSLDETTGECVKNTNIYLVYGVLGVLGVLFLGPVIFFGITKMIC